MLSDSKETHQLQEIDIEKSTAEPASAASSPLEFSSSVGASNPSSLGFLKRWNARIEGLAGFEARGLARVPEDERQPPSAMGLLQMLLLWFSANMTINNLAVGLTGPLAFDLGFRDSALCAVFGVVLGSATTAYMSTWGAASGNRTMVSAVFRYIRARHPPSAWISGLSTNSCSDCHSVFHGLLSCKNLHPPQHHPHVRLLHY